MRPSLRLRPGEKDSLHSGEHGRADSHRDGQNGGQGNRYRSDCEYQAKEYGLNERVAAI